MKKRGGDIIFIAVFFALIAAVGASYLLLPAKTVSESENRTLAKAPAFSLRALTSNRFTTDLEEYINDHMPARDELILVKNTTDIAMMKRENNGAVIGEDGYIFARNEAYTKNVPKTITALNNFVNEGFNVTAAVIPSSAEIYADKLPANAAFADEAAAINDIYSELSADTVDLVSPLKSGGDGLYFKTDHHLTVRGAAIVYDTLAAALGWSDAAEAKSCVKTVSGFKGAYYRKYPNLITDAEDFAYYDVSDYEVQIGDDFYDDMIDEAKLDTYDKYAALLYGNNPLVIIRNPNNTSGKKIAVFRDSYFNMLAPLIAENYSEIHVIDLRSFDESAVDYMRENGLEDALVLYSLSQLQTDGGLALLDD